MIVTNTGPRQNVALPTGLVIMSDEKGMVSLKANDLVRALRQAALDGAAMRHFLHMPLQAAVASSGRAVPSSPKYAKWAHVSPSSYTSRNVVEEWVAERYPTLTFTKTVWTNRIIDLVVPPQGKLFFQVEAGQLLYRPEGHPDVPDNWKRCDIPVVAFTANQLNLLRKLFKSPSTSTTLSED